MNHYFNQLAERASRALGSAWAFVAAVAVVVLWALSGPAFHYNDTWQLTINTGTTVVVQSHSTPETRPARCRLPD